MIYKIKRRYINKGTKQGDKKNRKGSSKSRIRIRIGRCGSEDELELEDESFRGRVGGGRGSGG